jgi:hypothetical protein
MCQSTKTKLEAADNIPDQERRNQLARTRPTPPIGKSVHCSPIVVMSASFRHRVKAEFEGIPVTSFPACKNVLAHSPESCCLSPARDQVHIRMLLNPEDPLIAEIIVSKLERGLSTSHEPQSSLHRRLHAIDNNSRHDERVVEHPSGVVQRVRIQERYGIFCLGSRGYDHVSGAGGD